MTKAWGVWHKRMGTAGKVSGRGGGIILGWVRANAPEKQENRRKSRSTWNDFQEHRQRGSSMSGGGRPGQGVILYWLADGKFEKKKVLTAGKKLR